MLLLVMLLACIGSLAPSEGHVTNICENRWRVLRCRTGWEINIVAANYGRTSRRICRYPAMYTTKCKAKNSLKKVQKACQGKQTCRLHAVNNLFGDPCVGTYKYLRVVYRCRPRSQITNICEQRRQTIRCMSGQVLRITGLNYGRTDRKTCRSRYMSNTKCHSSRKLNRKVYRKCNGRRYCNLWASNRVFGDPCRGTFKYLRVVYRCLNRPSLRPRPRPRFPTVNICEHKRRSIGCRPGKVLSIIRANYGRFGTLTCPSRFMKNTRCFSRRSVFKVRRKCNGRRYCNLWASNRVFGDPCRGTFKYLRVVYRCIRRPRPRFPTANICEHKRRSIGCRRGKVLRILSASYGRSNRRTCWSRSIKTTRCHARSSILKVGRKCNGRRYCNLWASNRVFGDPCRGTFKYLRVVYRCLNRPRPRPRLRPRPRPRPRFPTVNICEHKRRSIGCRPGKVLSIIRANYGRFGTLTCPSRFMKNTRCFSRRSVFKVRRKCNGRRYCNLWASNRVFGDPCRGTFKYLRVVYRCIRRPRPRFPTANICEHKRRSIGCRRGKVLRILSASYGRSNRRTCWSRSIKTTRCHARSSILKVGRKCNGRRYCNLWASNRVFGDPCRGTFKYLRVVYRCLNRPSLRPRPRPRNRRTITCEGRVARLTCPFGKKIKISHANYGRSNRSYCRRSNFWNTKCSSCRSLMIVRRRCNRRRSCAISATNRVFGDPCRGTYKYLDITYQCTN